MIQHQKNYNSVKPTTYLKWRVSACSWGFFDRRRSMEKTFGALTVRLALTAAKTNTVQQRTMITSVVMMPKLLYVARHAWPTDGKHQRSELENVRFRMEI